MNFYLKNPKSIVILGHPLEHTLSPLIHNYAFKYHNLDYVYSALSIKPEDISKLGKDFLKILSIYGGNITIPFKELMFNYLDKFSNEASEIGAINTFHNRDGTLYGYNTDLYGFTKSLENYENYINNKKTIILGTGGSSRAVSNGLFKLNSKEIIIISRDLERAKVFSDNYNQKYVTNKFKFDDYRYFNNQENLSNIGAVINTTPLGMYDNNSALSYDLVAKMNSDTLFYDLIYNPEVTSFLRFAKETKKEILNGKSMLIYQASKSFNIWTGYEFPISDILNLKL
ncbi:MAG: shikimate dehydrogenase [Candidatus Sericytochromatia bacterium]